MLISFNIIFTILSCLSFVEVVGHLEDRYKVIVVRCMTIVLIVISTVYVGDIGDYKTYQSYFLNTDISHLNPANSVILHKSYSNSFEYLYELINFIIRCLTPNYHVLRFVLACITMFLYEKFYLYDECGHVRQYSITIMFIVWCLNFGNVFIIRSTIAVAICLYSLKYLKGREFWRFFFCTIIAIGFHQMCWLWMISYFIYNRWKLIRKIALPIIAICILFSNYMPKLLLAITPLLGRNVYERVYSYVSRGTEQYYGIGYSTVVTQFKGMLNIFFLIALFEITIYISKKNNVDVTSFLKLYNIYLFGSVLYSLVLQCSMALTRVAIPFNDVQYLLIPEIFNLNYRDYYSKAIAFAVFYIYMLLRYIVYIKGTFLL